MPPAQNRMRRRRTFAVLAALSPLIVAPLFLPATATAQLTPGGPQATRPYEPAADRGTDVPAPKSNARSHVPAAHVPKPVGLAVTGATGVTTRIDGLTLQDQRESNNGNSFSLEPPDQGLCTGNGYVIEGVNNVFSISTTTGAHVGGPQSYDPFWNNGAAEIVRHADGSATYGPFVSDPKCYYDPQLGRFFMTELQLGINPTTGAFTGDSFVDIAVSKTSTPTTSASDWHMYQLNVRNDGTQGTPSHSGCPCLGDQPLIGADRYGFYVTTNEFPLFQNGFNGAQFYAFDKAALANGTMKVQRIEADNPPLAEGVAYSVQPATSPTAGQWSSEAGGTEYLLSALEFTGKLDNRIATWALTNTSSLTTATPDVQLRNTINRSEVYGFPPAAQQKAGPTPLADAVKAKEELLNSNDDRMNQVVYSAGKLWSGLNTVVKTANGPTRVGIAYFVVSPHASTGAVTADIANQGYVSVNRNSVMFPSIGVTSTGLGVMVFTLTGSGYYPSAADVHLAPTGDLTSGVQVVQPGTKPDDGFTGYAAYGGNGVGRWGDYSAAVADASGQVWISTEYIPGTFGFNSVQRQYLANWGTYVASVTP